MGYRRTLILLAIGVFLCSCGSQLSLSESVPPFESIAFVTETDIPELAGPESMPEAIEPPIYTGAVLGTMGGAIAGAAACGPVLYTPCVLIMSWYGTVAGSVGGAAFAHYNYSGLSDTDAAYITEVLATIDKKRDLNHDLAGLVEKQIPSETVAAPQDANVQVIVRLIRIYFTEVDKNLISTQATGAMIVAWTDDAGEQTAMKAFVSQASTNDIDDLIAEDGRLLESTIDRYLLNLAGQMSSTLMQLRNNTSEAAAK